MTVAETIERLKGMPQEAEVVVLYDAQCYVPTEGEDLMDQAMGTRGIVAPVA